MKYHKWYVSTRVGWMKYETTVPTKDYEVALVNYNLKRHTTPDLKHLLIRIDVVETSKIVKQSNDDIRP